MAKYTTLVLLLVMAISWSHTYPMKSMVKRDVSNDDSLEAFDEMAKDAVIMILMAKAEPSQRPILAERFKESRHTKFDHFEDYVKYFVQTFEEVTGKSIDDIDDSDSIESVDYSDESAESPVAEGKAIEV